MLKDCSFPKRFLGGCQQPGVLYRLGGDWERARMSHSGAPGARVLADARGRSPWRGLPGAGEPRGVCTLPPCLPPCLPSPAAPSSAHALQPQLRLSAVPGSAEPRIQLLFPPPGGASRTRQAPEGGAGGRGAAHFPPPEAEAEAGPLGRGERGLGGARGAADGTICPSARGPAGPRREAPGAAAGTPTSSGMSGRRLAPGLPRAGAARGRRARALRGPSPEVAACPVALFLGAAL